MRRRASPTPLLMLLGLNAGLGAVIGWLAAGALLVMTPLGPLFLDGPDAPLALVMLFASFTITFGSAAMGTAVFLLPKSDEEEPPPQRGRRVQGLSPVTLRAPARRS